MAKPFKGRIDVDIRDSTRDWDAFLPDQAPKGAPNVLVVLYDDTGLAAWSPYGGRIEMPTMQRLADNGPWRSTSAGRRPPCRPPQTPSTAARCRSPTGSTGSHDLRREGPRDHLPPDRAGPPSGRRAQRAADPSRRRRVRRLERVRGAVDMPMAERVAAEGPQVHALPHDRAVLSDACGAAVGRQPPHVGMGGITEIATSAPGETIKWVRIDTGDDDNSHLIPPAQHLEVIMSRQ